MNLKSISRGLTALHHAVSLPNTDISQLLIENGANINNHDDEGYTPLSWAIFHGNLLQVQFLLEHGADIYLRTGYATILHTAVTHLHSHPQGGNIIKLLLDKGAMGIINKPDNHGTTPLHSALKRQSLKIITMLIMYGADIAAMSYDGRIALHYAVHNPHIDVIRFVSELGLLDVNHQTSEGLTAYIIYCIR